MIFGILLGPFALAAILPLTAGALGLLALWMKALWLVVYSAIQIVCAGVNTVVSSPPSQWTGCWSLVVAQILIGALLGFGAGLRVQKPR